MVDGSEAAILLDDVIHFNGGGPLVGSGKGAAAVRFRVVRSSVEFRHHCCPAAAFCGLLSPRISAGETSTSAVIPGTYAPLGLSSRTFNTMVLISRLRRLTSRCVAKSPSTPLKKTFPLVMVPPGKRTRSTSPYPIWSAYVSG